MKTSARQDLQPLDLEHAIEVVAEEGDEKVAACLIVRDGFWVGVGIERALSVLAGGSRDSSPLSERYYYTDHFMYSCSRDEIMSPNQVVVRASATTANLGPGFDVFGLALEKPTDRVTLLSTPRGVRIEATGLSSETLPLTPEKNTAGVVASQILREFSLNTGVLIRIEKGILPGIGLGSSAASAVAVACGLNHLFDLKLDKKQLVKFAARGEVASAGFEHADNVSAGIYGDFVIVKSYNPLEIVNLKAPDDLQICVAYPHLETPTNKTEKARLVVPKQISVTSLVYNVGRAAAMATGFATGNVDLIGDSMADSIVEPARAVLIPGYKEVRYNALMSGACGVAISGAGPAMISIVNRKKADSTKVAFAMREGFRSVGLKATAYATKPGRGVQLEGDVANKRAKSLSA